MKFNLWRIAGIIIIFFLAVTIWYMAEINETAKRNNLALMEEKRSIEKKIVDILKDKKGMELELAASKKEKALLISKAADSENKIAELSAEIDKLKEDSLRKTEELVNKTAELEALGKKLAEYETSIKNLNGRLPGMPAQEGYQQPDEQVTLEPITVTKGKKDDVRILEVNTEYGFVVVNVGSDNGIKKNDVLYVTRSGSPIGRVVVEKVGADVSIAKILYKALADMARKGDTVSY